MTIKELERLKALTKDKIALTFNDLYIGGLPAPMCLELRTQILTLVNIYFEQEKGARQ